MNYYLMCLEYFFISQERLLHT